jgi:putative hydrolase of the HAD superfamily/pyrimidine and pyridine-specific 5'-nucleotidase
MTRAAQDSSCRSRDLSPLPISPPLKRSKLVANSDPSSSKAPCKWEVAFFDLDDCLYKNNWATEKKITERIDMYLTSVLGLQPGSSDRLYRQHGTTIAGLIEEKHINESEVQAFLNYAHEISLEDIKPDPQLPAMLRRVNCRRWVFSNSAPGHVERCLEILGIRDLFEGVIAASSVDMFGRCGYVTKPHPKCFQAAMDIAGVADPKACIFMDDSVRNIKTAKKLGWHAILVGCTGRNGENLECAEADAIIEKITDVLESVPELQSEVGPDVHAVPEFHA